MSLDLHFGLTRRDALQRPPVLRIEIAEHQAIFASAKVGLINRLSDYYCDAHFDVDDLPRLRLELAEMAEKFDQNQFSMFFKNFLAMINRALVSRESIYVFAD